MVKLNKSIKIVILGEKSVGKTSLRRNYLGESFQTNYLATIGVDFSSKRKTISFNDYEISVNCAIWDLAGHTNFEQFLPTYLKKTDGAIMVYSLYNLETLQNIDVWFERAFEHNTHVEINLTGNKWDLIEDSEAIDNQVTLKADEMSKLYNCEVFKSKTSAKTGVNVEASIDDLIERIIINKLQEL